MRQSLAGAAVRGTSAATIARQLLEAGDVEGLLAHNASVYGDATMMAKEDDEADDDDADDDESDDSDDEDDADDDEDEDKGDKKPDARSRRIQELAAESKKHRLKARDYRKERDDALAELEKLKQGKGKPAAKVKEKDAESDSEDEGDDASAELKAENAKLQEQLVNQQLRQGFTDLTSGSKPLAQFKNPKTAFKLLDLDDVEIVDGEIEGLDDAIKALAKSDPYLLVSKDEDDEDEDEVTERRRRRTTGQPTGGRSKKANPDREKLVSKYPALRR